MGKRIGEKKRITKWQIALFCLYIFLSFFETYLTPFFGNGTKFYLLFVLAIFLFQEGFKVKINNIWVLYLAWFLFKLVSVSWSNMTNSDFSTHFLSQIGMVLFVIVMTGRRQERELLFAILQSCLWVSFAFGIMSIIFGRAYIDERFAVRQVLTIFGQQMDPNNCAAFLLVGIALGLYSIIIEKKSRIICSVLVIVNTYALMLTSSRAGFLTIGAVVIILLLFPQAGKRIDIRLMLKKIAVITVVLVALIIIIRKYLPQDNMERLFALGGYSGGSGRDVRWTYALRLFSERPLFGWGWGGYSTSFGAIHNTFLTSLCDIGIIGTLVFVSPLIIISVKAIKQRNVLSILLFISGVLPAFMLEAVNKRFFWNAIVFSYMIILAWEDGNSISVWSSEESDNN